MQNNLFEHLENGDPLLRSNFIGSSDAPIIMGVSPWCTPFELYKRKVNAEESTPNFAQQRGIDKEDEARRKFEEMKSCKVFAKRLFHKEYPWIMASLDGISEDGKIAVEIKCAGKKDHEVALRDEVPEKYYPQLQHQMIVANLDMMYYFSYGKDSIAIVEVYKNEDYCQMLIQKEKEFYDCLINRTPPAYNDDDFIEQSSDEWEMLVTEWKWLQIEKAEIQLSEERVKTKMIAIAKERNSIGYGAKLQKIDRQGTIDYSQIEELKSIDLEKYRKPGSSYWKISLIEE